MIREAVAGLLVFLGLLDLLEIYDVPEIRGELNWFRRIGAGVSEFQSSTSRRGIAMKFYRGSANCSPHVRRFCNRTCMHALRRKRSRVAPCDRRKKSKSRPFQRLYYFIEINSRREGTDFSCFSPNRASFLRANRSPRVARNEHGVLNQRQSRKRMNAISFLEKSLVRLTAPPVRCITAS